MRTGRGVERNGGELHNRESSFGHQLYLARNAHRQRKELEYSVKKNGTISDIAAHATVSKSTVSRVLNDTTPVHEEKRKAVLAAMKEMNFEPNIFARGLASGQSYTVGVVTQKLGSPFYDSIAEGVITGLTDTSYSPIFADGQWNPQTGQAAIKTLIGRMVDGLIVIGSNLRPVFLNELKQTIPTLLVGNQIEGWDNLCMFIDNEQAAFDATQHLIELGHTQIAHITGIDDHQDSIRRVKGYRRALKEANIEIDEDLICAGRFDGESGAAGVEALLKCGKPFTAIFAANDATALGARLAFYRRGIRVPEDVSIVGFDDQEEAAFVTPPLTTIHQPGEQIGIAAAANLLKLINKQECKIPVMEAKLVVRESTCKVKSGA
jgi:LacI family transcriptional regulator